MQLARTKGVQPVVPRTCSEQAETRTRVARSGRGQRWRADDDGAGAGGDRRDAAGAREDREAWLQLRRGVAGAHRRGERRGAGEGSVRARRRGRRTVGGAPEGAYGYG